MIIYEPTSGATQRPGLRRLHVSAYAQVAALLLQVEPGVVHLQHGLLETLLARREVPERLDDGDPGAPCNQPMWTLPTCHQPKPHAWTGVVPVWRQVEHHGVQPGRDLAFQVGSGVENEAHE